jgi:hypothetical protein
MHSQPSMSQTLNMPSPTFHNPAPYLAYQPPDANLDYPSGTSMRSRAAREDHAGTFNATWYPGRVEYRTHDSNSKGTQTSTLNPHSTDHDDPVSLGNHIIRDERVGHVYPAALTIHIPSSHYLHPSVSAQPPRPARSSSTPPPRLRQIDGSETTHRVVGLQDPRGLRDVADLPEAISRRASLRRWGSRICGCNSRQE